MSLTNQLQNYFGETSRWRAEPLNDFGDDWALVYVDNKVTLAHLAVFLIYLKEENLCFRPYDDFSGKMAVKMYKLGALRLVVYREASND